MSRDHLSREKGAGVFLGPGNRGLRSVRWKQGGQAISPLRQATLSRNGEQSGAELRGELWPMTYCPLGRCGALRGRNPYEAHLIAGCCGRF